MERSACEERARKAMAVLQFDCRFRYPSGFSLAFAFTMEAGVTALVGPSGSGKTTVLNLIAGILTPDHGTISLHDKIVFDSNSDVNEPPDRREVGYVFQDYQLFPHLNVEQNLWYGQKRAGRAGASYEKIVEMLELADVAHRYPISLSGGQKQRVALGRALLRGPRLLLLDEPLSALDSSLRASVAGQLAKVIEEFRIPTLLVSHDQTSIDWLAHATVSMTA
jgi:molybdate transport system ATP-binding protein